MKWDITHRTQYKYASPVHGSVNELHLEPLSNEHQTVDSFLLKILPSTRLRHYHDFYSNCVHHFELPEPHDALVIESRLRVTTKAPSGLALDTRPAALAQLKNAWNVGRC